MARLRIEVVTAGPARAERVRLELQPGATLGAALSAAGYAADAPAGVYGRRLSPDTPLADGDRVEVYRPLRADPRQARRDRARRRSR